MALGPADAVVLATYVLATFVLGAVWGRRGTVRDYLAGGRDLPWWAVLGSVVATETSTVTFLSVPGLAFQGDWTFLQLAFGYVVGRTVVVFVLLPAYFQGEVLTAYDVLGRRFGGAVKPLASMVFLAARTIGDGLRLFLGALVLHLLTGWSLPWSVAAVGGLTIAYTTFGGLRAVVFTDCAQLVVYLAGAVLAAVLIARGFPGGTESLRAALHAALEQGKFRVFDLEPSLRSSTFLGAGLAGGAVLTLATHGADHMMVQRLLAARNQRHAAVALVLSGVFVTVQFALFLGLGSLLFVYFQALSPGRTFARGDEVLAAWMLEHGGAVPGALGVILGALFAASMSTLSSSLNASAASYCHDVEPWLRRRTSTEPELLRRSKVATVAFGLAQIAVGVVAIGVSSSAVQEVLAVAGLSSGLLLGLFLLARVRRADSRDAVVGFGLAAVLVLCVHGFGLLAWPWYAAVAAGGTVLLGTACSLVRTRAPRHGPRPILLIVTAFALCRCGTPAEVALESTPGTASGPIVEREALAPIDGLVAEALAAGAMPGCVVTVGQSGGVVFQRAYGSRALEPQPEAMTADTLFDLASLTKPVATATALFVLLEQGRVRLRDPVARHLPELEREATASITLLHLLTHTAGYVPDNELADYELGPEEARRRLLALDPAVPPGTRFWYSDVGFEILQLAIERVAGAPLHELVAERVFRPLAMHETGFRPDPLRAARAAPTEQRDGRWLRGEVHDPRAALLGGVAGHAGLFSTADDLARYARALLRGGELDGVRVLSPAAVARMGRALAVPGGRRTPGWDADSRFSSNRGELLSDRAFGHGGFTGTCLWIDPGLDLFVLFLSNRLHPDGRGSVNELAGRIATVAAAAVRWPAPAAERGPLPDLASTPGDGRGTTASAHCLPGIDVLRQRGFDELRGCKVGLITNGSARTRDGERTLDVLRAAPELELVAVFSPEHGLSAVTEGDVEDAVDAASGLPVHSLYGELRRPAPEQLRGLDTLVFDLQDAGVRYYTYVTTLGYAMEAAAAAGLRFVVLDRPNPLGGEIVRGPLRDAEAESFTAYHELPIRHGMTVGELALLFRVERGIDPLDLRVVPVSGWCPRDTYEKTGLSWIDPSPNLRGPVAALLYAGIGLLEFTNLSVGRGTDRPFEWVGAPWVDAREWARALNGSGLAGARFVVYETTPRAAKFAGERCRGVQVVVEDLAAVDPLAIGYEMAVQLLALHGEQFDVESCGRLLAHRRTLEALEAGSSGADLLALAAGDEAMFQVRRAAYLLYPRVGAGTTPRRDDLGGVPRAEAPR